MLGPCASPSCRRGAWRALAYSGSAIRSILRIWGEHRKRLLEEGCSTEERLLIEQGIL
jgi:hypothetical protein